MSLIAAPARVGKWVDTNTPLGVIQGMALVSHGYVGVMRYVPLPNNNPHGDITAAELNTLCYVCGLQVMLIQHCRAGHWDPRHHNGGVDGKAAAKHADAVGYPLGATLYPDVESIVPDATAADVANWVNTWGDDLVYSRGCYHGFDVPMTGLELYHLLKAPTYWHGGGGRTPAIRGDAIVQQREIIIAGVKFDENTLTPDKLGEVPMACQAV